MALFELRKADIFLLFIITLISFFLFSLLDAARLRTQAAPQIKLMNTQTRDFELTDLALFSEARYTRHLTQADRHTPFQSHPFALEYFPSGSLVSAPAHLQGKP